MGSTEESEAIQKEADMLTANLYRSKIVANTMCNTCFGQSHVVAAAYKQTDFGPFGALIECLGSNQQPRHPLPVPVQTLGVCT